MRKATKQDIKETIIGCSFIALAMLVGYLEHYRYISTGPLFAILLLIGIYFSVKINIRNRFGIRYAFGKSDDEEKKEDDNGDDKKT